MNPSEVSDVYWPMRAVERGMLTRVPARPDSIVDYVPVDYVIDAALRILDGVEAGGAYHLVAGADAVSVAELVELHASLLNRAPLPFAAGDAALTGGESLVPYFDVRCRFEDARAVGLLDEAGVSKPDPRAYLERLLSYARQTSWGKRPLTRQAASAQRS